MIDARAIAKRLADSVQPLSFTDLEGQVHTANRVLSHFDYLRILDESFVPRGDKEKIEDRARTLLAHFGFDATAIETLLAMPAPVYEEVIADFFRVAKGQKPTTNGDQTAASPSTR